MLEEELKILREFIDVFTKRGWIRESMLLARAPIMFVLKKNRKKRLVVNYQRLNNITIKDKYIVLLVDKIRERLRKAKWFILVYLDNILVYLEELMEHIEQVKKVLDKVRKVGFHVSLEKSKFYI